MLPSRSIVTASSHTSAGVSFYHVRERDLRALNRAEIDISHSPIDAARLASLVTRIVDGTISSKLAKEVFDAMWSGEGDADSIIERRGLKQISDEGALDSIVAQVIGANPAIVAEVRAGKEKAFNALVGKAMAASKGKANPTMLGDALRRALRRIP